MDKNNSVLNWTWNYKKRKGCLQACTVLSKMMMISYFHALQEHFSTHLTISHVVSLITSHHASKKREIIRSVWRKLDNEQYTMCDPNKCSLKHLQCAFT